MEQRGAWPRRAGADGLPIRVSSRSGRGPIDSRSRRIAGSARVRQRCAPTSALPLAPRWERARVRPVGRCSPLRPRRLGPRRRAWARARLLRRARLSARAPAGRRRGGADLPRDHRGRRPRLLRRVSGRLRSALRLRRRGGLEADPLRDAAPRRRQAPRGPALHPVRLAVGVSRGGRGARVARALPQAGRARRRGAGSGRAQAGPRRRRGRRGVGHLDHHRRARPLPPRAPAGPPPRSPPAAATSRPPSARPSSPRTRPRRSSRSTPSAARSRSTKPPSARRRRPRRPPARATCRTRSCATSPAPTTIRCASSKICPASPTRPSPAAS